MITAPLRQTDRQISRSDRTSSVLQLVEEQARVNARRLTESEERTRGADDQRATRSNKSRVTKPSNTIQCITVPPVLPKKSPRKHVATTGMELSGRVSGVEPAGRRRHRYPYDSVPGDGYHRQQSHRREHE